jgi:diaminopimelate epimerase
MKFYKYHGLGNDYLIIDPADGVDRLSKLQVRLLCHRNYGIGSDGILLGPLKNKAADFAVKIFNPDGSEAEKSGNGLRIFSRYLWDKGLVSNRAFTIHTLGGVVQSRVHENGSMVSVDMGRVSFNNKDIPVAGPLREVLNESLFVGGREMPFCAAGIGNPHCVIIRNRISPALARRLGPKIETHPLFPRRTNVQFVKVTDRSNIRIEIWERGAGYTLASGSSSSAAAAVTCRLGLTDRDVTVHMPGGAIQINLRPDFSVTLTGPATRIAEGVADAEMFDQRL